MSLVIAGERSGVGKTTMTLAILSWLRRQNLSVQSFKVGPDYIDPMFHHQVTGRACRNLDPVLTSERYVQQCFTEHTRSVRYALVEGVMGLFDGVGGQDFASTAHIACLLNLSILMVIDCSRLSRSVAAIAHGYRSFDPSVQWAGLILNRVGSDRHLQFLRAALEPLGLPILGVFRKQESITIPDRHLGLVPTAELPELNTITSQLADLAHQCLDWSRLLPLLETSPHSTAPCPYEYATVLKREQPIRIAIARDRAFSFYYPDNLDILAALGAELVPWSPLGDQQLPDNIQGLYFGGGFPEVFASELASNLSARHAVYAAIHQGIPTYAECGGLMYLCQAIIDFQGQSFPMVGALPAQAVMTQQLALGYRHAEALSHSPLITKGIRLWGHEFHRSRLSHSSPSPLYRLQDSDHRALEPEGWQGSSDATISKPQLHASYLHLHWGAQFKLPQRFLTHCSACPDALQSTK
jgi:cobyrinic acid a,c-diamide synthase